LAKSVDTTTHVAGILLKYTIPIPNGALLTDETAMEETAETLELAERCGDDVTYRDYRDKYRAMANALDFEGHIEIAKAMQ
jgi:hypothetical protein